MQYQPLNDIAVVRRTANETATPGGIILPDTAQEKQSHGIVLEVGPGAWNEKSTERIPMNVKVGDDVLFARYAGDEIECEGEKLCFIPEKGILAVVES